MRKSYLYDNMNVSALVVGNRFASTVVPCLGGNGEFGGSCTISSFSTA